MQERTEDDERYIERGMDKGRPEGEFFRIKVRTPDDRFPGESRWVHIPADRFDAVVQALTGRNG